MSPGYWVAVLIAIAASAGQIVLKLAVDRQRVEGTLSGLIHEPLLWLGVLIYAVCSVAWLWVLSKMHVSGAYPILSLSFALVPLLAQCILGEAVSAGQWLGISLVVAGVVTLRTLG